MMQDDAELHQLASAIADGAKVDWDVDRIGCRGRVDPAGYTRAGSHRCDFGSPWFGPTSW